MELMVVVVVKLAIVIASDYCRCRFVIRHLCLGSKYQVAF